MKTNTNFTTPYRNIKQQKGNLSTFDNKLKMRIPKDSKFVIKNFKIYDKSLNSNISTQKTQESSPSVHVMNNKTHDSTREKAVCLKDNIKKNFLQGVNISPDVTNKISHTENETTTFKLDLISKKKLFF